MAVVKVIEVLSESDKSWEDAANMALKEASNSIRNIKSLYVENMQVTMKDSVPKFRIDAKIAFEVEQQQSKK